MTAKRLILTTVVLALIVSCAPGVPAPTATPPLPPTPTLPQTPVAHNADWTPVTATFDGIEMVLVPPGCFMMGSETGRRDERPPNQVCFQKAFWIDRTEVTNAQYGSDGHFSGPNLPRENLLWSEAHDFCVQHGGRLPTEAEWEYAARGPDDLIYPWGNTLIDDNLVFDRNTPNQTADVGSRPSGASWVGALDMSGNVFEWVNSIYKPYPYNANDGREDDSDTTSPRVYRSGIRSYLDYGVTASIRFHMDPTERDWFLGFRCAHDA